MIQPPLAAAMKNYGVTHGDAVFLRIIKEPKILELWMKPQSESRYCLITQYPVVAMSGNLGPKEREGDCQAPEGFYRTHAGALNPNSKYHLSFNVCYPNAYDQAQGRTGSFIMVHGSNKSIGCFAMGDPAIEEIYGLVESYVKTPQGTKSGVPIHIYPFVPTEERLVREKENSYYDFWCFLAQAWKWTERHQTPAPVRFEGKEMMMEG